jgi:hypothetical protein
MARYINFEAEVKQSFGSAWLPARGCAPDKPSEAGGDLAVSPCASCVASLWADAVPFASVAPVEEPLHDSLRVLAGDIPSHHLDSDLRQQALYSNRAAALRGVSGRRLGETGLDQQDDSDDGKQDNKPRSHAAYRPCADACQEASLVRARTSQRTSFLLSRCFARADSSCLLFSSTHAPA